MRLIPLSVASLLILTACAAPSVPQDANSKASADNALLDAAYSSMMAAQSSRKPYSIETDGLGRKFDRTEHDGIYTNEEYGFSLTYPNHFEPLQKRGEVTKNYGSYFEEGGWVRKFKGEKTALLGLEAYDKEINAISYVRITAYPLEGYSDVGGEGEYAYDAQKDTWFETLHKEAHQPDTKMIGGKKAYVFGNGDAGWLGMMYAVPLPEKSVMLEFHFGGCPGCALDDRLNMTDAEHAAILAANKANYTHMEKEREAILNSIRFE